MNERHGVYYGPRAVPCECGSHEAYWHGPEAHREYACDDCWARRTGHVVACSVFQGWSLTHCAAEDCKCPCHSSKAEGRGHDQ